MSRLSFRLVVCVLCFVVSAAPACSQSNSKEAGKSSACEDVESVDGSVFKKRSGWPVLSFENRLIKETREFELDGVVLKEVTYDVNRAKTPEIFELGRCEPLANGGLRFELLEHILYDLEVVSAGGRDFAVLVKVLRAQRGGAGTIESFRYIDDDGDGVFELLDRGLEKPVKLPAFLKANKG